jgi:hypothetical protein
MMAAEGISIRLMFAYQVLNRQIGNASEIVQPFCNWLIVDELLKYFSFVSIASQQIRLLDRICVASGRKLVR